MKKQLLLLLTVFSILSAKAQVFDSLNATMLSNWFNPAQTTAESYGIKYNGIWGWADSSGYEYAIICSATGTYFIDVTNPANPVERDFVAGVRDSCVWREVKTYQNYCYVVSDDAPPNSFQIIDMSYLPDSVHVVYNSNALFERCHTIYIEGDKLYGGYVHGGSVGFATMAVFSLANPVNPVLIRNLNMDFMLSGGQVHDMYVRNDTVYASCGWDGLYIFKLNPNNTFSLLTSLTTYVDQGYNHSSALTEDGSHLFFTDEVPAGLDIKSLDVSDFSNLTVVDNFHTHTDATPHNPFIKGDLLYMAYYMDGLQVYDISNPSSAVRVAYYDTYFQNTPGIYPSPAYAGAWGAYPWLPSGNILVSDMQNGLFVIDITIPTLIEGNEPGQFSLSPNPVKTGDGIFLRSVQEAEYDVQLYDMAGRSIYRSSNTGDLHIPTTGMKPGLYNLTIIRDNEVQCLKVMIAD